MKFSRVSGGFWFISREILTAIILYFVNIVSCSPHRSRSQNEFQIEFCRHNLLKMVAQTVLFIDFDIEYVNLPSKSWVFPSKIYNSNIITFSIQIKYEDEEELIVFNNFTKRQVYDQSNLNEDSVVKFNYNKTPTFKRSIGGAVSYIIYIIFAIIASVLAKRIVSKTSLNTNQNDKAIDLFSKNLEPIYPFQNNFIFGFYFESNFDIELFSNICFEFYDEHYYHDEELNQDAITY